jgi:hypothetical protein
MKSEKVSVETFTGPVPELRLDQPMFDPFAIGKLERIEAAG